MYAKTFCVHIFDRFSLILVWRLYMFLTHCLSVLQQGFPNEPRHLKHPLGLVARYPTLPIVALIGTCHCPHAPKPCRNPTKQNLSTNPTCPKPNPEPHLLAQAGTADHSECQEGLPGLAGAEVLFIYWDEPRN